MKIENLLLSGLILLFIGCGGTSEDTDNLPNNEIIDQTTNVIPPLAQGVGLDYNITEYFFPNETLNNRTAYKDYLVSRMDTNGVITDQRSVVKHYLEGNENGSGGSNIFVFENNKLIKKSIIETNRISVYTFDEAGNQTTSEQYAQLLRRNEDLLRNENGACVLKQEGTLQLSDIIPLQANPNTSSANSFYNNVLYVHCGTKSGIKIDRYYAMGLGEIAEIYEYQNGSIGYSVYDRQTDQNPL